MKGFALQNFQNWNNVTKTELSQYGGLGPRTEPTTIVVLQEGSARHTAEFVFGMELRADAAYRVTRDISLRVGGEYMDFGKGVGRGINLQDTSQRVIMYGVTFGVTWNR